jgi:predicted amidohydrolase YtcJ
MSSVVRSRRRAVALAAWCAAAAAGATAVATAETPRRHADAVITAGTVITLDGARPRATAIAVRDGRIVAVGSAAEVEPLAGPATRRIAFRGAAVVPGLGDAHVHVEGLGDALESIDLVGAATLDEAASRVRTGASALPAADWVRGRGWDQNDWPDKRFPTAAALDAATGGRPAFLRRVDGHAAWVNTRALELAGVTAATPDPTGGRILRDGEGRPTGVLVDAAMALVASKIPPASREARKRRIAKGLRACAAAGLTSVHDAGVDLAGVALYKELLAEGPFPARAYLMLRGPDEFLAHAESLRPEIGLGDGQLTIRSIKVVADGALGSRGALLIAPYADEPTTRGLLTVDPVTYRRMLERAIALGFQVNTHAIGDAANRLVLDAYQQAFGGGSGVEKRFRIEHAQVIAPPDVGRFRALGVIPSVQPTHCTSDMYWATDRLGAERAKGAYLWRTFLDQGLRLPAGSDAPVESIDVVPGLHAAVTRQDAKGWPEGGWHPAERVSVEEALRMFSADVAFAAFEEADRGTIAVGKRADLTVLDGDPTASAPRDLLKIRVLATVVGGRVVHDVRPAQ